MHGVKRILCFVLAMVMCFGLIEPMSVLVPAEAANKKITETYTASDNPNTNRSYNVDQEELISNWVGFNHVVQFTDNPFTGYWEELAHNAADRSIIYGKSDGTFGSDDQISSKEAATLALRYYYAKTRPSSNGARYTENESTDYNNSVSILTKKVKRGLNAMGTSLPAEAVFSRGAAFLYAAAITYDRGYLEPSAFSNDALGQLSDGTTFVCQEIGTSEYNPNIPDPYNKCNGPKGSDFTAMSKIKNGVMAANYLMYIGTLDGNNGTLLPNDPCTRAAWYKLLFTIATPGQMEDIKLPETQDGPGGGGGGGYEPPEPDEPDLEADLSISASGVYANYADFIYDNATASSRVSLNASRTSTSYGITSADYVVSAGGAVRDVTASGSLVTTVNLPFTAASTGISDPMTPGGSTTVRGEVTIRDGFPSTDRATASASIKLTLTNEPPVANFRVSTDTISDPDYATRFFYVGEPVTYQSLSTDYENDWRQRRVLIKRNGANVAIINDFDPARDSYLSSVFSSFTTTGDTTAAFTFNVSGTYQIEETVMDLWGETDTHTTTITVTEEPAPPTAVIRTSSDYIFLNKSIVYTDASTDPNNDIVTWTWGNMIVYDEDADGNVLTTTRPATGFYSGSLSNKVLKSNPGIIPGGTLTFNKLGTYDVDLTVVDATGFTDTTTKQIKVIDNVPVLIVGAEPGEVYDDIEDITDPIWKEETGNDTDDKDPHWSSELEDEDGFEYPMEDVGDYDDILVVKENRVVVVDTSDSLNPPESEINDAETGWVFEGVGDVSDDSLVFIEKNCDDRKKTFIPTEPGLFKMTITLHNEYSDNLALTNPNAVSLAAREKTILIQVLPDVDPSAVLTVSDVNPTFGENNSRVTVPVSSVATSSDNDVITMYEWTVIRDDNENGDYSDDDVYYTKKGKSASEINIPVKFENTNGRFYVELTVTETFGQSTVPDLLPEDAVRTCTSSAEFDVNWTPDITFSLDTFAYVDDVLTYTPKLKDESVEDCTVSYEILRRNSDDSDAYETVNPASFASCTLTKDKLNFQFDVPGYYIIKATIVDAEGNSYTFTSNEMRIYDLPTAVIQTDDAYIWDNTPWTYKEARKFYLTGSGSYAYDSVGEALHEIDHSRDVWSIRPLDTSATSDDILVEDREGNKISSVSSDYLQLNGVEMDHFLAILEPGKYEVTYQVTNSYGKQSIPATQVITIAEDTPPKISCIVNNGTPEYDASTGLSTSTIYLDSLTIASDDEDKILDGYYSIKYAYDKDNDGDYDEETWKNIPSSNITIEESDENGIVMGITLNESGLGNYKFVIWAKDTWGQDTLASVPESEVKETTYEVVASVENTPPNGTFTLRKVLMGNVVMSAAGGILGDSIESASKVFGDRFGEESGGTKLDVAVEEIEGGSVDMSTAFNWQRDVSGRIGAISFGSGGSSVDMVGNESEPGKNCIYIEQEGNVKQEITFSYSINFGDSFNAGGMLFGLKKEGNLLKGYMFSVNNRGAFSSSSRGTVWQVCWRLGSNDDNMEQGNGTSPNTMKKLKDIPLAMSDTLTLTIDTDSVTIKGNSLGEYTVSLPGKDSCGFGFFSDHYSHGCSRIGQFNMTNITLTTSNMKTLEEILNESTWRLGSEKFVIFAPGEIQETMSPGLDKDDPNSYARLLSLLEAQNIHLIIMSSAENYNQMEDFIDATSVESINVKVTSVSQFNSALKTAEEFIKRIMLKNANTGWWILVNDEVEYLKHYEDKNKDPQWLYEPSSSLEAFWANPSYLAQYFCYYHDYTYFDNSMGEASFSENRLNKEITRFTKVGVYDTDYKIKDNPVPNKGDNSPDNPFDSFRLWSNDYGNDEYNKSGEITNPRQPIYVHRRPVADFTVSATRASNGDISNVKITSNAYDLDHNVTDKTKKGLEQYQWGYMIEGGAWVFKYFLNEADGVAWINEMLSKINFTGNKNVMVKYSVRDYDGDPLTETIKVTSRSGSSWVDRNQTVNHYNGVWSEPNTIWISNGATPPVALFSTDKTYYNIGEAISITDKSYSPSFYNLTKWEWSVERKSSGAKLAPFTESNNGAGLTDACNRIFNWIDNQKLGLTEEENCYVIKLTVTDDRGQKSETYSVQIYIDPENKGPTGVGTGSSIFRNSNPTIYEYDDYDDHLTNPYFGNQLRGHEVLDWGLNITDPDNNDKYGTANDSNSFSVQFMLERYEVRWRSELTDSVNPVKSVTFSTKTVSAAQAKVSSNIQPFSVFKDNGRNLSWGSYRITALITDKPNNGKPGATTQMVTSATRIPLDLYVIPKLFIDDAEHKLSMIFNGAEYEPTVEVVPGEFLTINVQTSNTSTGVRIKYKDGEGTDLVQEMTAERISGNVINWTAKWELPENIEEDDLDANMMYYFDIETYTNYGGKETSPGVHEETRAKAVTKSIKVLPVKLYDFAITGITDPSVDYDGTPVYIPNLAFDTNNASTLMKKGYAFTFMISSKGLNKDGDSVRLTPKFYGLTTDNNSKVTGITDELEMYYIVNDTYVKLGDSNDTYKLYTSSEDDSIYLGTLGQIELPTELRTMDGNTQHWTGRYGIPGSAVFVKAGEELTEDSIYQGPVLIGFSMDAMKNGVAKYNYAAKGQWRKEFFANEGTGNIINIQKQVYDEEGLWGTYIPVFVFDNDDNALSNFETRPVWNS